MAEPLSDEHIDQMLERLDQTEPALQRRIIAVTFARLAVAQDALNQTAHPIS